jgi:predicted  nucleic acid-binding Zn-ribbon protein
MAYKCVHCSKVYKDGSQEVLTGCNQCSSKFFFYIREEKLREIIEKKDEVPELSVDEKKQIEEDVRDIAGIKDEELPVFLDFESIKIVKPGKYLLDLTKLFEVDKPKIYQIEDGKYVIDLLAPKKRDSQ